MRELQNLLRRFLGREIGLKELQQKFGVLLEDDSELAASAAAWLDAGEKDGRLSAAVCTSLKNVLVTYMAASNIGPDPGDSGIFDTLEKGREQPKDLRPEDNKPDPSDDNETFVRDSKRTAIGSHSIDSKAERRPERKFESQSVEVDAVLKIGSLIGGRYELLSQLGSGGMGKVFKARDRLRAEAQDRNPHIALKVLSESFKEHPDSMIALQREARRAQTLAHPNVITVHEFFRDGPHLYMTMELLDGKPLDQLLQSDYSGGLPFDQAWPIIEGVCRALQYGHKKGIVHSDIKPGNIFICDDGTIKVLDLGISRPIPVANVPDAQQTVFDPGKRLGSLTPAYASLEMWYQDTPDPRDDIYALSCVAYLLLTGRHPFDGQSAKKASEENLVPMRIDSISRGQWSALAGGLKFHRSDRIKSVDRFLALVEPQSVVRSRRRTAILLAALVASMIAAVSVRFYGIAVEDRVLDDRGRLQTPTPQLPTERGVLTAEQQDEVEGLLSLAEIQFESIGDESSADDLTYVLSVGPNNVVQLVDTVLQVDPGYEAALELRQRVFDVYLAKARQLEDEEKYEQAMSLTRNADAAIPNTSTVLRLQRSICDSAPAACVRQ